MIGISFEILNTLIAAAGLTLASLPFFKNGVVTKALLASVMFDDTENNISMLMPVLDSGLGGKFGELI